MPSSKPAARSRLPLPRSGAAAPRGPRAAWCAASAPREWMCRWRWNWAPYSAALAHIPSASTTGVCPNSSAFAVGVNLWMITPAQPKESTLLYSLSYNPPYNPPHNKRREDDRTEPGVTTPAQPKVPETKIRGPQEVLF